MIYLSRKQVKINILNIHLGVAKTPIKIFFCKKYSKNLHYSKFCCTFAG